MGNKQPGSKGAKAPATPAAAAAPAPAAASAAPAPAPVAAAPVVDKNAKHGKYNMSVAQYEQHYAGWLGLAENGRIRKTKFVDMMVGSGVDKEMAEILFDTYDADGSGDVDVDEFLGLVALTLNGTDEEQIRASFHAFDKDRSGTLTKEELRLKIKTLLRSKKDGSPRTAEEIAAMETEVNKLLDDVFELIDTDKSGSIDIDEYVKGFAGNPQVIEFVENLRG
jgi:Ca2+-binding EF-hand superfamily protein